MGLLARLAANLRQPVYVYCCKERTNDGDEIEKSLEINRGDVLGVMLVAAPFMLLIGLILGGCQ